MLTRHLACSCLIALLFFPISDSSAEEPGAEPNDNDAAPVAEMAVDFSEEDFSQSSVEELFAQAEKLAPKVKSVQAIDSDEGNSEYFGSIFNELLKRAEDKQLERLVAIYSRLKVRSFAKIKLLPPLAGRLIQREARLLQTEHRTITLPEASAEIPEKLKSAPADLVAAWRSYQSAKGIYEKEFADPGPKEKTDAGTNDKAFYKLIDAALRGETGLEGELRQYAWTGANCLGITDVEDAQDIANLLMLLRERRLDLAVEVAIRVSGTEGSISKPEDVAEGVIDFLRTGGLDWETLFIGAEVDRALKGFAPWDHRQPLIEASSVYGGDRTGTLLNQLARFTGPEGRKPIIEALELMIGRPSEAREVEGVPTSFHSYRLNREGRPSLSPDVQRLSLHTVEQFANSQSDEDVARIAISIFARTQATSSIPALQELTLHSSPDVAVLAARVLMAMGQSAPELPAGDIAFQVLVNGQPLPAGKPILWEVRLQSGSGTSSVAEVTADGLVKLDRSIFRSGTNAATQVRFSASFVEAGTQFEITLPPPANLESVSQVNVQASQLEIVLRNQERLNTPFSGRAEVEIRPHRSPGSDPGPSYYHTDAEDVAASPSILLSSVQNGTYDVSIGVNGAERWHGVAEVGPGARPLVASLRPGSDLHFAVINPDGEQIRWGWEILKDGKPIEIRPEYDKSEYHNLPCGEYVLHIPGNEKMPRTSDEARYADRNIPFTISAGSPAVIDLGQIRLGAGTR